MHLRITSPARWTVANRTVVLHAALGISSTGIGLGTRILATLINAGGVGLALRVVGAAGNDLRWNRGRDIKNISRNIEKSKGRLTWLIAVGEGISLGLRRAAADGAMLLGQALSSAGTRRVIQAGIDTIARATGLRVLALIVRGTALIASGF